MKIYKNGEHTIANIKVLAVCLAAMLCSSCGTEELSGADITEAAAETTETTEAALSAWTAHAETITYYSSDETKACSTDSDEGKAIVEGVERLLTSGYSGGGTNTSYQLGDARKMTESRREWICISLSEEQAVDLRLGSMEFGSDEQRELQLSQVDEIWVNQHGCFTFHTTNMEDDCSDLSYAFSDDEARQLVGDLFHGFTS